jgi:hypothetical protein
MPVEAAGKRESSNRGAGPDFQASGSATSHGFTTSFVSRRLSAAKRIDQVTTDVLFRSIAARQSPPPQKSDGELLTPGTTITCLSSLPVGLSLKKDNIAAHISRAKERFCEKKWTAAREPTGQTQSSGEKDKLRPRLDANDCVDSGRKFDGATARGPQRAMGRCLGR